MKHLLLVLSSIMLLSVLQAQENGLTKDQIAAIESVMAPIRTKVETTLKNQNSKMYSEYQTVFKNATAITDPKKQKTSLDSLTTKYYSFIKAGYSAAKIDELKAKASILSILKNTKYTITYKDFMAISGVFVLVSGTPTSGAGCIELTCPIDVANTTLSSNLLAFGSAGKSDCYAYTSSFTTLAGATENISALGKSVQVPAGMSKVEASCKTTYSISGTSYAVIGGGYVDASVGLQFKGPGLNKKVELLSRWAVAPVIWFTSFEETGSNNAMLGSFTPTSTDGDYTVQAYAKSYAFTAALISGSLSDASVSDFSPLKVCFIK